MRSMLVPLGLVALAVARTASVRRRLRATGSTGVRPGQQRSFWAGLVALDLGAGLAVSGLEATRAIAYVLVTFVAAPLLLRSLPEWWVRRRLAAWRLYRVAARASTPLVAVLAGVAALALTRVAPGSHAVLAMWAVGGIVLWLPLLSPLAEHRAVDSPVNFS